MSGFFGYCNMDNPFKKKELQNKLQLKQEQIDRIRGIVKRDDNSNF